MTETIGYIIWGVIMAAWAVVVFFGERRLNKRYKEFEDSIKRLNDLYKE